MAEGYIDFIAGSGLSAADLEDYCERQSIMRFTNAAARDAALLLVKTDGMYGYLKTTKQLTVYDGTNWVIMSEPEQSYNPATGSSNINVSGVGAAATGTYKRGDGWVDVTGRVTLGSTGGVSGDIQIPLPIAAADLSTAQFSGNFLDAGANEYPISMTQVTSSKIALRAINTGGTYGAQTLTSGAVPFAWSGAAGDGFYFGIRYRMASRYS